MLPEATRRLCGFFADILDYPGAGLATSAAECAAALHGSHRSAAAAMQAFADFAAGRTRGAMEELYTETFEMTPANTLNIGYHLFGDGQKRSVFLVRLEEAYKNHGFSSGAELADHLGVLLRFLSIARDPEFAGPLVHEAMAPVLKKLNKSFAKDGPGYGLVLGALEVFLVGVDHTLTKAGGLQHA